MHLVLNNVTESKQSTEKFIFPLILSDKQAVSAQLVEKTKKIFFKIFIYLFLERGEGREKERERNVNVWLPLVHPLLGTWLTTQACALTGN